MNWINRIKGINSSLMADEQDLLTRTLHLMKPFSEMLDRALDCLPAVGMRAVFRGVPVRLSDQFKINDEFIMEPHTSTSLEGEEALTFMDPKKPGTFFVLRLHSPAMIDFMSAYPHQAEALLAMHSSFRVANKLSRTVLRMLGCRFDVITLTEGGSNATDTEQIDFLRRSAKQTFFIYREYLNGMIPIRIALASAATGEEKNTVPLLDTVNELLQHQSNRCRGNGGDKAQHVVVTGNAGCGKTSATLSAYSHLVQQDGCFAVLIPLPSVKNFGTKSDVDNAVLEVLDISTQCFIQLCNTYRVFIILDSLDEVGGLTTPLVENGILPRNDLLRQHVFSVVVSCRSELFETFRIKQPQRLIVGSQLPPAAAAATMNTVCDHDNIDDDDVSIWTIAPFSEDDSNEMIKRHAMRDGTVSEAELLQHASCAPVALQRHPLYLQMILRIPAGTLESGATRSHIYKQFIDAIVADAYSDEQHRAEALGRLQRLALHEMLLKEQWQVTVGTAKKVLGCSGEELELLPFRVDDPHDSKSQLGFLHRSQAEYLAAMELAKTPSKIRQTTDRITAITKRGTLYFILEKDDSGAAQEGGENAQEVALRQLLFSCDEGANLVQKLEHDLCQKEETLSDDNTELATALLNLGKAYATNGETDKDILVSERARSLQVRHYGADHIVLADTSLHLGIAYGQKGRNAKKLDLATQALHLQERHFGTDHIALASTLVHLGNAYGTSGDNAKKLELLERALRLQEQNYGPDHHVDLATTLVNLGNAYSRRAIM